MRGARRSGARRWLAGVAAVALVAGACERDAIDAGGAPPRPSTASTAVPAAAGAPWDPAATHAVIIGILSFADPSITPFPAEHRKDRELAETLVARGVPRERVTVLLDHHATSDAMLAAVEAQSRSAAPGATLLVYYAGHGTRDHAGEVGFLAWDARPHSAFSVRALGRAIAASFRGERVLLLADCCHSGGLAETAAGLEAAGLRAAAITSADASSTSTANWTYTEALVDAFRGAPRVDHDRDGAIRLGELAREVEDVMRERERQRAGVALGSIDPRLVVAPAR